MDVSDEPHPATSLGVILTEIFRHLDAVSLVACGTTCRFWRLMSRQQPLWRLKVLQRWSSQRHLYDSLSLDSLDWHQTYQELAARGMYAPDDMKYFVFCRVRDEDMFCSELRESMIRHMRKVVKKWTKPLQEDYGDHRDERGFNKNMELYFDTNQLCWTYLDRRRGLLDDSVVRRESRENTTRYIRPFMVAPSCLMLYRWLCLFRTMLTPEVGLAFYRIYRVALRHVETGMVFELFDWKAAMSCTLTIGYPYSPAFRRDALELLQLLSHPYFVADPQALSGTVSIQATLSVGSTITTSTSGEGDDPASGDASNDEDDEDEDEDDDDTGYAVSCDYYITMSNKSTEEQHLYQAFISDKWLPLRASGRPVNQERYHRLLHTHGVWISEEGLDTSIDHGRRSTAMSVSLVVRSYPAPMPLPHLPSSTLSAADEGGTRRTALEPMPSCLALYRLICLFDIGSKYYRCVETDSAWRVELLHRTTGFRLLFRDHRGSLEVLSITPEFLLSEDRTDPDAAADSSQTHDRPSSNDELGRRRVAEELAPTRSNPAPAEGASPTTTQGRLSGPVEGENDYTTEATLLLDLLMNVNFAHPYGSVAGSVV